MPALKDLTGQRFDRLIVLRKVDVPGARNAMWECRCDCGQLTVGAGANLGKTKLSCGCMRSENGATTIKENRLARPNLHGQTRSITYKCWASMRRRCLAATDPLYPRYGGRGITICDRWFESFENFLNDMGERPSLRYSIDRIDNDGNYEPSNCRWATAQTQNRNRSTTRFVEIDGVSLCVRDWSARLGVGRRLFYDMTRSHHSNGYQKRNRITSIDEAILTVYRERVNPDAKLS